MTRLATTAATLRGHPNQGKGWVDVGEWEYGEEKRGSGEVKVKSGERKVGGML